MNLFPVAASSGAHQVDQLYLFLVLVSLLFAVLIFGLIAWFSIRYRRRPGNEVATQIANNNVLEITWIVIPLLIALVMFGWGAKVYLDMSRPPRDAMQFHVVGKQWMWKIEHPTGQREINALHVPVGRAVRLVLTSADVIHSFYVPAFRIKMDAVPGRYTSLWFRATRIGSYRLFCAEYCGTDHSRMGGEVIVMAEADYAKWLEGGVRAPDLAGAGFRLAEKLGCINCHSGLSGVRCPPLAGLFGRQVRLSDGSTVLADEAYLLESIVEPRAKVVEGYEPLMPPFKGLLNDEELMQLVAWMKSLATESLPGRPRESK